MKMWLQVKQKSSSNQVFQMCVNFVLLVDHYREFQVALNLGDAVMMEALYCEFLPTFSNFLSHKKETLCQNCVVKN